MAIIPHLDEKRQQRMAAQERLQRYTEGLAYLERGWPIIPVRDKIPLTTWKKYQHMQPTDAQLMAWLSEEPCPDIAIVTGAYAGLLVLDIDGPKGEKAIKGRHIPVTPMARTPRGGRHIFFKHPGGRIGSTVNLLSKVDIRADGGYVVAPPASGRGWVEYLSPDDVPLADVPEWLLALLTDVYLQKRPAPGTGGLRRADTSSVSLDKATEIPSNYVSILGSPDRDDRQRESVKESVKKRAAPEALHALTGAALREWYNRTDVCIAIAQHMGLTTSGLTTNGSTKAFRCVLHEDKHPSAGLFVHYNGGVLYKCFHGGGKALNLPQLAVLMTRQRDDVDRAPRGPELATWALRLLVETGHVAPAPVQAHKLPGDVDASVKKVYDGFLSLLAVKWLHTPGEATTFSWRFAAGWCGASESEAKRAMRYLRDAGYIREAGEIKAAYGRSMCLFLPGTAEHIAEKAAEGRRPR